VTVDLRRLIHRIVEMGMEPWFTLFSPSVERAMRADLSHVVAQVSESLPEAAVRRIVGYGVRRPRQDRER